MMKPLTPQEVHNAKVHAVPEAVISIINDMLLQKCRPCYAEIVLRQSDILKAIQEKLRTCPEAALDRQWLTLAYNWFRNCGWFITEKKDGRIVFQDFASCYRRPEVMEVKVA